MGVGNLAHFMHKRTFFINSRGVQTGAVEGPSPHWPPHFNHSKRLQTDLKKAIQVYKFLVQRHLQQLLKRNKTVQSN